MKTVSMILTLAIFFWPAIGSGVCLCPPLGASCAPMATIDEPDSQPSCCGGPATAKDEDSDPVVRHSCCCVGNHPVRDIAVALPRASGGEVEPRSIQCDLPLASTDGLACLLMASRIADNRPSPRPASSRTQLHVYRI